MLCETCQKQLATIHITQCTEGDSVIRNLCVDCHEQNMSAFEREHHHRFNTEMKTAGCKYCGEPAIGGSGGFMPFLENLSNGQEFKFLNSYKFWCEACAKDLAEFAQLPENRSAFESKYPFEDVAAQQKLAVELAERTKRQEAFMKGKAASRDRK